MLSGQGVGELLQTLGRRTSQKSIRRLLEVDVLFAQAIREPMVLVETHPRRERKVGAHAHEHPTPALVVDIEVILDNPAICRCHRFVFLSPMAVMIRAGSRALRTTTARSECVPLKARQIHRGGPLAPRRSERSTDRPVP